MHLRAKYLSGHHCVDRQVLVSTTVVRGHMSVVHIIQQIVMSGDCIVISNCQYVVNFEF